MTLRLPAPRGFAPVLAILLACAMLAPGARAQAPGGPPPAVGVVTVEPRPVTESAEFIGRVSAVDRVQLTARVTAFLEERLFTEGSEVQAGDLLYKLERGPFEAAVQQAAGTVAQISAQLDNANIALARAQSLLNTPAGQRSLYDDAKANQRSLSAQLLTAQAQLRQAQINLAYTEIHAPVAGKISRTLITNGNVVSPSTGPLATIVSQDPMYVLFPISERSNLDLQRKFFDKGGLGAVTVRLKLADGTQYDQPGHIDYVDPTVAQNTDTVLMRAKIANPALRPPKPGEPVARRLTDGEFVTVTVEGLEPIMALAIPRVAVLSDQQGSYVWVVDAQNKVEQR
ncbi:MAG: efflux RND transporter periplasmic adaptor subunit, partial [Proteobacteria bacterium]|nr:efflux RND transporter periplasmic adaptor subunit [Pseudomonadota bacterium]